MKDIKLSRRNFVGGAVAGSVIMAAPSIVSARSLGGAALNLSLIHISEPTRPY